MLAGSTHWLTLLETGDMADHKANEDSNNTRELPIPLAEPTLVIVGEVGIPLPVAGPPAPVVEEPETPVPLAGPPAPVVEEPETPVPLAFPDPPVVNGSPGDSPWPTYMTSRLLL